MAAGQRASGPFVQLIKQKSKKPLSSVVIICNRVWKNRQKRCAS